MIRIFIKLLFYIITIMLLILLFSPAEAQVAECHFNALLYNVCTCGCYYTAPRYSVVCGVTIVSEEFDEYDFALLEYTIVPLMCKNGFCVKNLGWKTVQISKSDVAIRRVDLYIVEAIPFMETFLPIIPSFPRR